MYLKDFQHPKVNVFEKEVLRNLMEEIDSLQNIQLKNLKNIVQTFEEDKETNLLVCLCKIFNEYFSKGSEYERFVSLFAFIGEVLKMHPENADIIYSSLVDYIEKNKLSIEKLDNWEDKNLNSNDSDSDDADWHDKSNIKYWERDVRIKNYNIDRYEKN